jgi:predicted nucleic acid-binding protein
MTLVVDASIAAKWALKEESSAPANALRTEEGLIAPSLITAELGSAFWKAFRRGTLSRTDAIVALRLSLLPIHELIAAESLHNQALALAIELNHPVYDCFYLTLAAREKAPLVTADETMLAAARKAKIEVRLI